MTLSVRTILVAAGIGVTTAGVFAGELSSFEGSLGGTGGGAPPLPAPWMVEAMALIWWYGGRASWDRIEIPEPPRKDLRPRRPGEALIPFLRADGSYQNVTGDVEAFDWRVEAGYGPIGGQTRITHYREEEPDDDLDVNQYYLLYRTSLGEYVEVDWGLGAMIISGEDCHSGLAGTIPVLVHPADFWGIEFRPAWAGVDGTTVADYDLGVVAGWRFISVRAGWRWFQSPSRSLDGPWAGISLRF